MVVFSASSQQLQTMKYTEGVEGTLLSFLRSVLFGDELSDSHFREEGQTPIRLGDKEIPQLSSA
jgi:hypothetical protein